MSKYKLIRSENNPIIKPSDVPPSAEGVEVIGAFNPGAIIFEDKVILLLRVAEQCIPKKGKIRVPVYRFNNDIGELEIKEFDLNDPDVKIKDTRGIVYKEKDYLTSLSHIRLAWSNDGINFKVEENPFIAPCLPEEAYGMEDARATLIEGKYYLNYSVVSSDSWCTALALTKDFKNIEKIGIIFHPENKDVAIFPEKVNGKYIALHRPNNSGFGKASIWYAESPDLIHWGAHRCLLRPRKTHYESIKIGGGSSPIKN